MSALSAGARVALASAALLLAPACGRVPQSADCAAFTACVRALDEVKGRQTNLDRFDPAGPCWGRAEGAELCTTSCGRGLALLRRTEPVVPPACGE